MEPKAGITALQIILLTGGGVVTFVFAYVLYMVKLSQARLTALEQENAAQKVTNGSFAAFQEHKDLRDKEFRESVNRIGNTLEEWRKEFNAKFEALTTMIHEIQLDRAAKQPRRKTN